MPENETYPAIAGVASSALTPTYPLPCIWRIATIGPEPVGTYLFSEMIDWYFVAFRSLDMIDGLLDVCCQIWSGTSDKGGHSLPPPHHIAYWKDSISLRIQC